MSVARTVALKALENRERKRKRKWQEEGREVVEITRQSQREKDKRRRDGYRREGEKEIKQLRKTDKSLNSYPGREVDGKWR